MNSQYSTKVDRFYSIENVNPTSRKRQNAYADMVTLKGLAHVRFTSIRTVESLGDTNVQCQ